MKLKTYGLLSTFLFVVSAANAGDTGPLQRATEIGAKKCLKTVEKVADYVIENAAHGTDATWNNKNADARLLSFFVSRGYSDGDSQVNMQFAPNSSGGCDAMYTETVVIESQCSIVREDTFKNGISSQSEQ